MRVIPGPQVSHALQVMSPLLLTFLVLVLAAAVALWTSASGAAVVWATLISVGLMGATTALLQGGLFGLAGLCPPIYVQACSSLKSSSHHRETPKHETPLYSSGVHSCMHHQVKSRPARAY